MIEHKKAKNKDEAWKIQEDYKGKPHGWIQWKGTNVCMDIHCKCGAHLHADCDFLYNVKCLMCATVYMVNGHVELISIIHVLYTNSRQFHRETTVGTILGLI